MRVAQCEHHFIIDGELTMLSGQIKPGQVHNGDTAEAVDANGQRRLFRASVGLFGITWVTIGEDADRAVCQLFRRAAKHVMRVQRAVVT